MRRGYPAYTGRSTPCVEGKRHTSQHVRGFPLFRASCSSEPGRSAPAQQRQATFLGAPLELYSTPWLFLTRLEVQKEGRRAQRWAANPLAHQCKTDHRFGGTTAAKAAGHFCFGRSWWIDRRSMFTCVRQPRCACLPFCSIFSSFFMRPAGMGGPGMQGGPRGPGWGMGPGETENL